MAIDIFVKNDFKEKMKKPGPWDRVWPLVDWVKNLIEKKWPGLSDSGMASGGLKTAYFQFFMKYPVMYPVIHVLNDHAFITRIHKENYIRQKYMHFSIFGQDSLNGKVINEKRNKSGVKYQKYSDM